MAEIETLTSDERDLLLGACRGLDHAETGEVVDLGVLMEKALRILDAQATRIAELEAERDHWMAAEDRAQQRTNALSLVLERIATVLGSERGEELIREELKRIGYPTRSLP